MTDVNVTAADDTADAMELVTLVTPQLYEMQEALAGAQAIMAAKARAIKAELARRFAGPAKEEYARKGKSYGALSLPAGDGLIAKAETKQTVDWDSPKLEALAGEMRWEDARHYFDVTFSMKEATYKALPPDSNLKKRIDAARTTKLSDLSVKLVKKGE